VARATAAAQLRDVRQRCEELKAVLVDSPDVCTAEEIADYWPGGSENKQTDFLGWLFCHANYVRLWGRVENLDGEHDAADAATIQQATLDAFREKPVTVELVGPGEHGTPAHVAVHPKSLDTLTLIDELDAMCRWLAERLLWLEKRWDAEAALKVPEALRELTELQLTMVWIAITPGCGAPFDPSTGLPDLPPNFRRYDALDVMLILKAHHQVNRNRISIITGSLRQTASTGPASWATLAVGAAKALRQPIEHLMRNRSLGAWLAQAAITWDAEREAQERANPKTSEPVFEEMG
jgi:hypothetical protein